MSGRWKADYHLTPVVVNHYGLNDETMRNWLKQAVRRAEADGVHLDSGHTTHLPAQLYHAHALSPPAPESHPGTGWSQGSTFDGGLYQSVCTDMAATLAVPS